jgi:hypothetical protein
MMSLCDFHVVAKFARNERLEREDLKNTLFSREADSPTLVPYASILLCALIWGTTANFEL